MSVSWNESMQQLAEKAQDLDRAAEPELPKEDNNPYYVRKTDRERMPLRETQCFYCGKPLMRRIIRKRPACDKCHATKRAHRWRIDHVEQIVAEQIGKALPTDVVQKIEVLRNGEDEAPAQTLPFNETSMRRMRTRLIADRMDAISRRDDAVHEISETSRKIDALTILIGDDTYDEHAEQHQLAARQAKEDFRWPPDYRDED
jgi:ribosomal protein L37AE/L43A